MRVRIGDKPVLKGIHAKLVAQHQPGLQSVAYIVAGQSAERVFTLFASFEELLEPALFVRCAQPWGTLRVAFHLKDLDFRIQRDSPTEVRIVRNGQSLAIAGAGFLQPLPHPLRSIVQLDRARNHIGNRCAAEDYVPMQHADAFQIGRPLKADESCKFAGLVELLGDLLQFGPNGLRAIVAIAGPRIRTTADARITLGWVLCGKMTEVECRCCVWIMLANSPANLAGVHGFFRIRAQSQFAQPDVMVGDCHEV